MNLEEQQNKALIDVTDTADTATVIIPLVKETFQVDKITVETAKINISKKVTSEDALIDVRLLSEAYDINRVAINQVVNTPPPGTRYEGETMIISVVKEVLIVEKKYEIIEELHITKRTTERNETQHITLLKEEVEVQRKPVERGA